MSEEFLNGTNISTVGEKGSGKTMTERMSRYFLYDIGSESIFFDFIGDKKTR
jgi:hypothetical protein